MLLIGLIELDWLILNLEKMKTKIDKITWEFREDDSSVGYFSRSILSYSNKQFNVLVVDNVGNSDIYNGIQFSDDGTKLYFMSHNYGREIHQVELSTPFDISTATKIGAKKFIINTANGYSGLFFKSSTEFFITKPFTSNREIQKYILSTPWDITTATLNSVFTDTVRIVSNTSAIFFSSDGVGMMVLTANKECIKYILSTPWDITTATFYSFNYIAVQNNSTYAYSYLFSKNWMVLYVGGDRGVLVKTTLSTPWDTRHIVSEEALDVQVKNIFKINGRITSIGISNDETKIYLVCDYMGDNLNPYYMSQFYL